MINANDSTLQASNTSFSVSKDITSTPTIGAHDLRVMTLRINGWLSPCKVTRLAICEEESNSVPYNKNDQQEAGRPVIFYSTRADNNLDDRIMARLGKMTFTASTFDVKTQYAKWGHF